MQKYEHAFGKNDIRGIYGEDITEDLFYNIGLGYSKWLISKNNKNPKDLRISVCMDARLHSPSLKNALITALENFGVGQIEDLGLAPTPIGYYSEFAHNLDGALIITASHNPSEYNGLKMTFNKRTLDDKQIQEIKNFVFDEWHDLPTKMTNNNHETSIIPEYIEELKSKFGQIGKGVKVVVDSANATGGIVGPQLYRKLGCEVIELFSEPDGRFPNHHPNPSVLSTLETLSKTILDTNADFGIAYDGDSDRIGVVDSNGTPLTGDKLLLIYAMDIINSKPVVVSEVKCSQVLYDTINKNGGTAHMSKTGHGYIKSMMKETNAVLGGEMSGHTFFKDRYYGFDDAVYAGCRMIEIVAKNKQTNPNFNFQELLKPFNAVFTSDEVRFSCPNEFKKSVLETMTKFVEQNPTMFSSEIKDIITLDGLRIVLEDGFALIRQSNTEPVFTLRFEAKDKEQCEKYMNIMLNKLKEICDKFINVNV